MKLAGLVGSGVDAKMVIQDGLVKVNGETEYQRGKKLRQRCSNLRRRIFSSRDMFIKSIELEPVSQL